jgi:hypothetical protein
VGDGLYWGCASSPLLPIGTEGVDLLVDAQGLLPLLSLHLLKLSVHQWA